LKGDNMKFAAGDPEDVVKTPKSTVSKTMLAMVSGSLNLCDAIIVSDHRRRNDAVAGHKQQQQQPCFLWSYAQSYFP
jgi:hypothetical protein